LTSHSPGIEGSLETLFPTLSPEALALLVEIIDAQDSTRRGTLTIVAGTRGPLDRPETIHKPNGSIQHDLSSMAQTSPKNGHEEYLLEVTTHQEFAALFKRAFGISFKTSPFSALPIDHISGPFGFTKATGNIKPTNNPDLIIARLREIHRLIMH